MVGAGPQVQPPSRYRCTIDAIASKLQVRRKGKLGKLVFAIGYNHVDEVIIHDSSLYQPTHFRRRPAGLPHGYIFMPLINEARLGGSSLFLVDVLPP